MPGAMTATTGCMFVLPVRWAGFRSEHTSRVGLARRRVSALLRSPFESIGAIVPTSLAEVRYELALASRMLANEGVLDAFGHVSMRHPDDPGRYLLPRSRSPQLVEPGDVLEYTLDSEPVKAPKEKLFAERVIHGCIYRGASGCDGGLPPSCSRRCCRSASPEFRSCRFSIWARRSVRPCRFGTSRTNSATPISLWSRRRRDARWRGRWVRTRPS